MEKFVIQGGVPLSGEITAAGNKNAALPILAACLLTEEELVIANVPRIRDTEAQIALLADLGVETEWVEDNTIRLCAKNVKDTTLDEDLSAAIRASFLMAGPLLARFGEVHMPPPGGDFIGRRRLDAHLDAFRELGARIGGQRMIEPNAPPGALRAAEIPFRVRGQRFFEKRRARPGHGCEEDVVGGDDDQHDRGEGALLVEADPRPEQPDRNGRDDPDRVFHRDSCGDVHSHRRTAAEYCE